MIRLLSMLDGYCFYRNSSIARSVSRKTVRSPVTKWLPRWRTMLMLPMYHLGDKLSESSRNWNSGASRESEFFSWVRSDNLRTSLRFSLLYLT